MAKTKFKNPVIETYKGRKVHQYPFFIFRTTPEIFKSLIDLADETGLSIAQLAGHSSKPCDCCRGLNVVTFNADNEKVFVPRGILFKSALTKHGTYNRKKIN